MRELTRVAFFVGRGEMVIMSAERFLKIPDDINEFEVCDSKPYENEHAARIEDPGKYDEFRRKNNHFKDGVHAIFGIIEKPKRKAELQSIRFDKNKYTVAEAKKWLKDNDIKYTRFEPAKGKEMEIERKEFSIEDFEVKEDDDGIVTITGYANTKGKKDRYGDIPTVFEPHRNYVYELKEFKKNPVLLLNHFNNTSNIAGSFNPKMGGFIREDEKGLKFKAVFSKSNLPEVAHARTVYKEGHGRALSIGGRWHHEDKDHPEFLTYAEIFEISLVGVGADPNALTEKRSPSNAEKGEQKNLQTRVAELEESIKAGRVLSKDNETKLRKAGDMISEVLKSLEKGKKEEIICRILLN